MKIPNTRLQGNVRMRIPTSKPPSKLAGWLTSPDLLLKLFPYNEFIDPHVNSPTNLLILPCTRDGRETLPALREILVLPEWRYPKISPGNVGGAKFTVGQIQNRSHQMSLFSPVISGRNTLKTREEALGGV